VKTYIRNLGLLAALALPMLALAAVTGDLSHLTSFDWHAAGLSVRWPWPTHRWPSSSRSSFEAKRLAAEDKASRSSTSRSRKAVRSTSTRPEARTGRWPRSTRSTSTSPSCASTKSDAVARPPVPRDAGKGNDGSTVDIAGAGRSVSVKTNLPKGIGWTRCRTAMAQAKGNVMLAHEIAKERFKDTPQVVNVLKAAISLGGTRELPRQRRPR
jgi:hypothetical protein